MILCDTGPLVAAFNRADRDHTRCAEFLTRNWTRLVIPSLAVTEVCHLLADPQARYRDLGPDWHPRRTNRDKKIRAHLQALQALGVTAAITDDEQAA